MRAARESRLSCVEFVVSTFTWIRNPTVVSVVVVVVVVEAAAAAAEEEEVVVVIGLL